jgi:hypothetical protein
MAAATLVKANTPGSSLGVAGERLKTGKRLRMETFSLVGGDGGRLFPLRSGRRFRACA